MKVRSFCSEKVTVIPEKFRLNTPASPHFAARIDHVSIHEDDFQIPKITGNLVIEGAGGLMVPLNDEGLLYIDLLKKWKIPVILVARHYLGSINHTLLSLELLKQSQLEVCALIFSGEPNKESEAAILKQFPVKNVFHIPFAEEVNAEFVAAQAALISEKLFKL